MKLTTVEFKNFKSIKEDSLHFTHNCMILVGKNEAGKSNILKGIAGGLSSNAYKLTSASKRKRNFKEVIDEAYIDFIFTFSPQEIDVFTKYINKSIKANVFSVNGKTLSNQNFIETYCKKGIYRYNIINNTREPLYYSFPESTTLAQNFIKLNIPYNQNEAGAVIPEPDSQEPCPGIPLKLDEIEDYFSSYITNFIGQHIPPVYYWKNDNNALLSPAVDISSLKTNPSNYSAIQTLFSLAGYPNISAAFTDAINEDGDCINLLNNVAQKATAEFQKRWPDLKGVSFEFRKDGENLLIKIKEKVAYNFEDRSDGFKHFISILLILSSQVEIKKIHDAIIIIDEPDNSLYPTASKYLRDELIKLSSNNIIVYATHSPFMIDSKEPSRHIIVSKRDEISKIEPVANEDLSYQKDDVLLNAIGTSRFEFIKEINLIFEGGTDFAFFNKALEIKKAEYKELKEFFKKIGATFVHGVSSIKHITPILLLANKDIFILSDNDSAAKQAKDSYCKEKGYQANHWYTFADVGVNDKETIEDFISDKNLFIKVLNDMGKTEIQIQDIPNQGIMRHLAGCLNKEQKQQLKNLIVERLTPNQIDVTYYSLLQNLKEKIENATENR